jgi:RsiW-degrading membrane proteinase PrsW (M82 family)
MLFWALADHSYGYFTLLRFVVCLVTAYCAVLTHSQKDEEWTWIFGAIAVLFNPIMPLHMNRQIWIVIDVLVAAVLIVSMFIIRGNKVRNINSKSA